MKKTLIAVVLTIVLCLCAFGTTLALLMDTTDPVINTFTVGNVDITLTETDFTPDNTSDGNEFKMVPGNKITKDPKVTVVGGSEKCWLFVKIEKSANFKDFMSYAIADGWTLYSGDNTDTTVYYREVEASSNDQEFSVLKDNTVEVSRNVTKEQMDEISNGTADQPTLTFTAYAVQWDNVETAADAWGELFPNP